GIYKLVMHDAGWSFPMLLEKGKSQIHIPDKHTIFVESGELQQQINECNHKLKLLTKEQVATTQQLQQEKDSIKQQALQEKAKQLEQESNELVSRYIQANKNNLAGVFLVWDKMEWVNFQELERRYQLLDKEMQQTSTGNAIRKEIDRLWHLKPGVTARNFTMPDTSGNPVTLFDIQAKVKILDFWASWCIPCRAANKKLLALYEKYKSQGLEIISVSVDSNEKLWKQAIRKDGCNWIHLSELNTGKDALYRQYKVFRVPACFLLDEHNRCIAAGANEENFEEMILNILKHSSENL
ncbi:MAG: TlpA family protein disulfide reductase, partial [Odoribacter sp.]|nr:TlpA family protein disulfide reductase [Odoribacter sp.]